MNENFKNQLVAKWIAFETISETNANEAIDSVIVISETLIKVGTII